MNDIIDYMVRPLGIMRRRVTLDGRWWRDGDGPLLAAEKETGRVCALIPDAVSGYRYFDPVTNASVKVNKNNKDRFEEEAVCFYRPLPMKTMTGRELIIFLVQHISKSDALLIAAVMLMTTLTGILTPLITMMIFAQIIPSGKYVLLVSAALLLTNVALGRYLLSTVKTAILSRVSNRMDTQLENGLIGRVLNLPVKFFADKSAGGVSQSIFALSMLPDLLTETIFSTGIAAAMSLLYILQVALMEPALSVSALVTFGLEFVLIAECVKQKRKISQMQLEADREMHSLEYSLFSSIRKIKVSGSENRAFAKWSDLYRKGAAATYVWRFPAFMQNELFTVIQMTGLLIAYKVSTDTGVSVAGFAAFSASFGLVMAALMQLSASADIIAGLQPVLKMGAPVLDCVPENSGGKSYVEKLDGSIEMDNVSFRYDKDGPWIIDNLNLKINPGEYVAIVGKSGCGKSTLMRLMLGFEKPDDGAIYYGKHDLSSIDLASFRRHVGTVLQNGKLFAGDLYSNITISAPWLNMDDAWEAARMAGIADDIENMPMGMRTNISEGGGGISGGQRQRIMIARALAPKPSILMLDEATSALDNITQKIVADSLNRLKCTRIVIAHRLSTIRECDRIIVIDGGKIAEDGNYEELMAQKGLFFDLMRRQQVEEPA
ncbi:MAG: ATP-binding cassette domain-containing protein [Clostridia bacterium]|nr:ATP-binding cassette domain-containing protein [Clostridia bacterium]MBQ6382629.1 ATP-binding cassette domain-containing protein [Clostridia bacterium]